MKNYDFQPISRFILEIIQDTAQVTTCINDNRNLYAICQLVPFPINLNDLSSRFQGHAIIWHWLSQKWCVILGVCPEPQTTHVVLSIVQTIFDMWSGVPVVAPGFGFQQNLRGFGAPKGQELAFACSWPMAYTTAGWYYTVFQKKRANFGGL